MWMYQEDYKVQLKDMSKWYTYKRTHEKYAMAIIVIDKSTGRILGAHVLGSKTEEFGLSNVKGIKPHLGFKEG